MRNCNSSALLYLSLVHRITGLRKVLFIDDREKGRYRYAGQWKHGRMHGCGVYSVNERITYVGPWNKPSFNFKLIKYNQPLSHFTNFIKVGRQLEYEDEKQLQE